MDDENNKKSPDAEPGAQETASEGAAPEDVTPEPEKDAKEGGWGKGELEELRSENADLKDKMLRLVAEMENLRRRTERDKADTAKYAISNFARDVLTIADNIQRAIDHVPDEAVEKDPALKSFREGIQVTERELLNMMERHGIARLEPGGERFDPNKHQAIFEVPNTDVPEGTIVEVVQAGYVIADRVLRPAMVGVSKGGPKAPKPAAEDDAETATEQPETQQERKAANDDEAGGPLPSDPPPGKGKPKMGGKIDKSA